MKAIFKKTFSYAIYYRVSKKYDMKANRYIKINSFLTDSLDKKEKKKINNKWGVLNVPFSFSWHSFYKQYTGSFDENYVPSSIFNGLIERTYNPLFCDCFDHKGLLHNIIDSKYLPKTIVNVISNNRHDAEMNLISYDKAYEMLLSYSDFVVKESISGGGHAVKYHSFIGVSQPDKILRIKNILNGKSDFIVQECIKQTEEFGRFSKNSVNTIRLVSLNLNDNISVLSSFLRMGQGDSFVDNLDSGGILIGLREDGTLFDYALDSMLKRYFETSTGVAFHGLSITSYEKIKETAILLHSKIPFIKLIGWDFTIDENRGITAIEINLCHQQIEFQQFYNGPLFGDRTDEVIEYIRTHKPERFIYG